MRRVSQTTQFARDVRRMRKRGKDLEKLKELVTKNRSLPNTGIIPYQAPGRTAATVTSSRTGS